MKERLTLQDVAMAPKEVAEVLGVKVQFVMRLLRAGNLKGGKMGKFWRVYPSAVNAYMNQCIEAGNGRSEASEGTLNKMKYNAGLKSMAMAPKSFERLDTDIKRLKGEIQIRNQLARVPKIARLKSTVEVKEEKSRQMQNMPDLLNNLSELAYPGMRALADEDPDDLEQRFTREAQDSLEGSFQGEESHHYDEMPFSAGPFAAKAGYAERVKKPDLKETAWKVMKADSDS
jgi:excisionase family DNA binding protein